VLKAKNAEHQPTNQPQCAGGMQSISSHCRASAETQVSPPTSEFLFTLFFFLSVDSAER